MSAEDAAALRDYLVAEHRMQEALEVALAADDPLGAALEKHLAGDFDGAAGICRDLLEADPGNAAAMLYLGRALFNAGEREAALAALTDAVRLDPAFAEGWYALAHASRACGDLDTACDAYGRALEHSPGLRQARLNLGITLFNMDDALGALACFEELLRRDADDLDALVNSGLAKHLLGELDEARGRMERALVADPGHPDAHRLLAAIHSEGGDVSRAVDHMERALAARPDDAELYAELARIHELSGGVDRARKAVEHGLALDPHHPALGVEMAKLDRRAGAIGRAIERLQRIDPRYLPPRIAQQYFHEIGFCEDRLHHPVRAMAAFEQANDIGSKSPRAVLVDRNAFFERVEALERWLDREPDAAPSSPAGGDLCFLVGFPRSGTTLLDTMLDAHPAVASVDEKPTLERVIERLEVRSPGYPEVIDGLCADDLDALRERYRAALAEFLPAGETPDLVVDKAPVRLIHAAFMQRLFPAARFIFALRHPCDVVLSNFMQLYEPSEAFVHTDTLAGTVRFYDAVMRLWARLAPRIGERLHYIRYESLVADPEAALEALCRFLGIEWSPRMVETRARSEAAGRVRTASYQQVTEDVYSRASGRWHRYRSYLEPHLGTLEPHARALGYSINDSA